jgi:Flp pilus assembly protein CpaB
LTVLADGKTLALGKTEHNSETGDSRTVEYVTTDLTLAEAQRLAAAKAITYKICNDEFRANDEFLCQAREVLDAAAAWKKAPPAKK